MCLIFKCPLTFYQTISKSAKVLAFKRWGGDTSGQSGRSWITDSIIYEYSMHMTLSFIWNMTILRYSGRMAIGYRLQYVFITSEHNVKTVGKSWSWSAWCCCCWFEDKKAIKDSSNLPFCTAVYCSVCAVSLNVWSTLNSTQKKHWCANGQP